MAKPNSVRGMDHVGITVPDLDAASRFFEEAFGAEPIYDNIRRTDPPFAGPKVEAMLGAVRGVAVVAMRMLRLGDGPGIELFEMRAPDQQPAVRPSDFGLQHFAVYVDDIDLAVERFIAAGGSMMSGPNPMMRMEAGDGNFWWYGRTPWGAVVEFITYPSPGEYERHTPLRRWRPPA